MTEKNRTIVASAGVAVGGALLLSVSGAFGTGAEPLGQRLLYWLIIMGTGSLLGQLCRRIVERSAYLHRRRALQILVLTAVVGTAMCVVVWATTGLFFDGNVPRLSRLWPLILPVMLLTAAVCTLVVLLSTGTPVQTHTSADAAKSVRFIERLPVRLRSAKLLAVEAEDHYLRVHTDHGSELILMRLRDALEELDGLEGARTHRSWWVAKDAVRNARRRDGRATLELEGGLKAPVSRRYARFLRDSNWF